MHDACCGPRDPGRPTRRTVLRGGVGVAVSAGIGGAVGGRARAAQPTGSTKATEVTDDPTQANPAPGDAVYGLSWLAGDTHVHNDHSSDGSFLRQTAGDGSPGNLSVGDQISRGIVTGLAWMPLTDHRTYDQHWDPLWTSSSLLLMPGEEANGTPHAIVLGAIDEIVDAGNPVGSAGHRHAQQSIWEAHAQGAAWGTAHPTYSRPGPETDNANLIGMHWIEVYNPSSYLDDDIEFAEDRWNRGYRTGVSGACDDHFKELWAGAGPGQPTTFVLAAAATERAILDGLHAGRTTVGNNPAAAAATARRVVLELKLAGSSRYEAVGGDEVAAAAGATGLLRITVSNGSGTSLLIYANPGRFGNATPLINQAITLPTQVFTAPITIPSGKGWWRAELRGAGAPGLDDLKAPGTGLPGTPVLTPDPSDQPLAVTAPIFTYTDAPARPMSLSAPPPATLAPAWADDQAAPVVLGSLDSFTGFPALAVVGGVAHLAAERHVPGETHIVYRLGSDAEKTLSTGTAARLPRVAANATDVWVVWEQDTGTQLPHRQDIWLAHSADAGKTFAAPRQLTGVAAGGRAIRPDITVTTGGVPVVVWQQNGTAAAFDVFALVGLAASPVNLSGAGKTVAAALPSDTRTALYPASLFPTVTALPAGGVAVGWQDDRYDPDPLFTGHGGGASDVSAPTVPPATKAPMAPAPMSTTDPDAWEPMVAVLPALSAGWGAPVRVSPNLALAQRHPSLVARPDGSLVIAWDAKSSSSSSGADPKLMWSTSHDSGVTWEVAKPLDAGSVGTSQRPRLGIDPSGQVRVVWHDSRATDWRWRVRTAVLDDGAGWVGAADVSTAGNSMFPVATGGFTTWTTDRGAAPQRDVTQRVVLASPALAATSLPEAPLAVALPLAAVGVAAAAALIKGGRAEVNSADGPAGVEPV